MEFSRVTWVSVGIIKAQWDTEGGYWILLGVIGTQWSSLEVSGSYLGVSEDQFTMHIHPIINISNTHNAHLHIFIRK